MYYFTSKCHSQVRLFHSRTRDSQGPSFGGKVTRKKSRKRLKHTGNQFKRNY